MKAIKTKGTFARASSIIAVTALSMGLAACDKAQEPPTVGQQIDSAIQKTDQAATDAKIKAEQALNTAEIKTEQALNTAETKMDAGAANASAAIKDATASATALANDAGITGRVSAEFAKDPDLSAIRIDVDTQAGAVRLTGPAPSQAAKDRASALAEGVEGVISVNNELIVNKG